MQTGFVIAISVAQVAKVAASQAHPTPRPSLCRAFCGALKDPVSISVSASIQGRLTELTSNTPFICDLPLTRLAGASERAGGNQTLSWVFATNLNTASYSGEGPLVALL